MNLDGFKLNPVELFRPLLDVDGIAPFESENPVVDHLNEVILSLEALKRIAAVYDIETDMRTATGIRWSENANVVAAATGVVSEKVAETPQTEAEIIQFPTKDTERQIVVDGLEPVFEISVSDADAQVIDFSEAQLKKRNLMDARARLAELQEDKAV